MYHDLHIEFLLKKRFLFALLHQIYFSITNQQMQMEFYAFNLFKLPRLRSIMKNNHESKTEDFINIIKSN